MGGKPRESKRSEAFPPWRLGSQELIEQGPHAVPPYQPQADKMMRMRAQTAMIENGFVHLPEEAEWLAYLRRW